MGHRRRALIPVGAWQRKVGVVCSRHRSGREVDAGGAVKVGEGPAAAEPSCGVARLEGWVPCPADGMNVEL